MLRDLARLSRYAGKKLSAASPAAGGRRESKKRRRRKDGNMTVLVTGGTGYIGSHTCISLLKAGMDIVVIDNLSNSKREITSRITELGGREFPFYECDIRDEAGLDAVFSKHRIDAVIHFAGLKAVGESVEKPAEYYDNNVGGSVKLLLAMKKAGVKKIVFSSSATVYGNPKSLPLSENSPVDMNGLTNPYGRSKAMVEQVLTDSCAPDREMSVCLLRYFNPVGAHESGLIGEDPNGIPNNLMPRLLRAASGEWKSITVFGDDYPTRDGTGVRDYIHVCDLAQGHVNALEFAEANAGCHVFNLGTGIGYSVYEMVAAMEKTSGKKIVCEVTPRRTGDVAEVYADPSKAREQLRWEAKLDLQRMCEDSWRWQQRGLSGRG